MEVVVYSKIKSVPNFSIHTRYLYRVVHIEERISKSVRQLRMSVKKILSLDSSHAPRVIPEEIYTT